MNKFFLLLVLTLSGAKFGFAAPIPLKNKLVFAIGNVAWTMNPDGGEQTRVWQAPKGCGRFGGFSHDGKQAISYNRFNLYVHNLTTGRFRRILLWSSGFGTFIDSPSFSPDGKQILCAVGSANTKIESSSLLCLNVNETYSIGKSYKSVMRARIKPTKLHEFSDFRQPRWSADGKRIIAVGGFLDLAGPNGNRMELWTMNKDGSQAQRVTSNNLWDEMPALSPKQDQIAFVRHFTDESGDYVTVHGMDLYIMNTDAKNERQLTNNKETSGKARTGYYNRVSTPLFNLAGNQIAFTQNGIIYRIDSDGQNLKRMGGGDLLQWIW